MEQLEHANLLAEESLVATLLKEECDISSIYDIASIVRGEHFANKTYGRIYDTIIELYRKRNSADAASVAKAAAEEHGRLVTVVDVTELMTSEAWVSKASFKQIAHDIRADCQLRRGKKLASLVAHADCIEDLQEAHTDLGKILDTSSENAFSDTAQDTVKILDTIISKERRVANVRTGYHKLDELTGGLKGGEVTVIGARPHAGKTTFALCCAWNMTPLKKVGFMSVEMDKDDLYYKLFAMASGVDPLRLRQGHLNDAEIDRLTTTMHEIAKRGMILDFNSFELNDLLLRAKRMKSEHKIDILIIDYLQLIGGGDGDNREQRVASVSRNVKILARELGVHIFLLSQLNRASDSRANREPEMGDLRESGMIEADADFILMPYRDDDSDKQGIGHFKLVKNRPVGVVGKFDLIFVRDYGRFENI